MGHSQACFPPIQPTSNCTLTPPSHTAFHFVEIPPLPEAADVVGADGEGGKDVDCEDEKCEKGEKDQEDETAKGGALEAANVVADSEDVRTDAGEKDEARNARAPSEMGPCSCLAARPHA